MLKQSALHKQESERAFEQQIRENEALIHKVCRMYAFTHADRQDLFQEIVIQLWRAYPGFRGQCKFSTWTYRIAINTAISALRKEKVLISSVEPGSLPTHIVQTDHSENEEQLQELYSAIRLLNQIERAVIMLYLEDYSYEEMEDVLGISQGTIRVKMSRIKEKLRQLTKNS